MAPGETTTAFSVLILTVYLGLIVSIATALPVPTNTHTLEPSSSTIVMTPPEMAATFAHAAPGLPVKPFEPLKARNGEDSGVDHGDGGGLWGGTTMNEPKHEPKHELVERGRGESTWGCCVM